jgi:transcriptional regulator with XRE-family HTH domain
MPKPAKTRTQFAENLATARKAKGLSQRELARLVKVTPRVIGLYETIIKNPTPDIVVRIAGALRVSIDELMGHKPIKNNEPTSRMVTKTVRKLEHLPPKEQKKLLDYINLLDFNNSRRQNSKT